MPASVSAMTVNKVCGSGLKAVALAAQAIRAGDARCILAGGFESMSNIPYAVPKARDGLRLGDGKIVDLLVHDGLWDVYNDFHMGNTGELVAEKYGIAREAIDEFGMHRLTEEQWDSFARSLVYVPQSAGPEALATAVPAGVMRLVAPRIGMG